MKTLSFFVVSSKLELICVQLMSDFFFSFSDEDANGAIDHEELKRCFNKLEVSCTEEEFNDLFEACDINENMGIKFNEFIVLLCLVYLLKVPEPSHAVSLHHLITVVH